MKYEDNIFLDINSTKKEVYKENIKLPKEKILPIESTLELGKKTIKQLIALCKENKIKYWPRQLDHSWTEFRFNYNTEQTEYLTGIKKVPITTKVISFFKNGINLL